MALVLGLDLARRRGITHIQVLTDDTWVLKNLLARNEDEPCAQDPARWDLLSARFLRDRARQIFEQFETQALLAVETEQAQEVRDLALSAWHGPA
jgi:hypothetical protein